MNVLSEWDILLTIMKLVISTTFILYIILLPIIKY